MRGNHSLAQADFFYFSFVLFLGEGHNQSENEEEKSAYARSFIEDLDIVFVDTPDDHNCLFWSAVLGLLLPYLEDTEGFDQMYDRLFGQDALSFKESIRGFLCAYDCHAETLLTNESAILRMLVRTIFRGRVVDKMTKVFPDEISREPILITAKTDNPQIINWDDYTSVMRQPITWGGDAEIRAMSQLAQVNIHVISEDATTVYPFIDSAKTLYLRHVNINMKVDCSKNHYHYGLSTTIYEKLKILPQRRCCAEFFHKSLIALIINILSLSSSINGCFVRAEKIDEFFAVNPEKVNEHVFSMLAFHAFNLISVMPEAYHNKNINNHLSHFWHKITLNKDQKSDSDHKFKILPDDEHVSSSMQHVTLAESAGYDEILDRYEKSNGAKNVITASAILLFSLPVAIAHGIVFYDANEHLFHEEYKLAHAATLPSLPIAASRIFSTLGAAQHFLHGSIALAEGASRQKPKPLFCDSLIVNFLLFLPIYAEVGLFFWEFKDQIIDNQDRFEGVHPDFFKILGISFSCISASMYLGHEGQSFLKLPQAISNLWNGKYNRMNQEEFTTKQQQILMHLAYAIVYGLARYQALINANTYLLSVENQDNRFSNLSSQQQQLIHFISGLSAIVCGISRFGMLSIIEEEEKYEENEEENSVLQYDAYQRGKDTVYEIACASIFGLLRGELAQNPSPLQVMLVCMLAGLISEGGIKLASYIHGKSDKYQSWQSALADAIPNVSLTILVAGLAAIVSACVIPDDFLGMDQLNMVITPLITRHSMKKAAFYPRVRAITQSFLQHAQSTANGARNKWCEWHQARRRRHELSPQANELEPLLPHGNNIQPEPARNRRLSSYDERLWSNSSSTNNQLRNRSGSDNNNNYLQNDILGVNFHKLS